MGCISLIAAQVLMVYLPNSVGCKRAGVSGARGELLLCEFAVSARSDCMTRFGARRGSGLKGFLQVMQNLWKFFRNDGRIAEILKDFETDTNMHNLHGEFIISLIYENLHKIVSCNVYKGCVNKAHYRVLSRIIRALSRTKLCA